MHAHLGVALTQRCPLRLEAASWHSCGRYTLDGSATPPCYRLVRGAPARWRREMARALDVLVRTLPQEACDAYLTTVVEQVSWSVRIYFAMWELQLHGVPISCIYSASLGLVIEFWNRLTASDVVF